MRLLLVDDDSRTAAYLLRALSESGHVVDHADDGREGLALALEGIYDVVMIESAVPSLHGLQVARRLRALDAKVGIVMLSRSDATEARVEALEAGCDDYLVKPYAYSELLARLDAVGRRTGAGQRQTTLRVADLSLDVQSRKVVRAGREIALQHRDYLLLKFLMERPDEVVSRTVLLEVAWGYDFDPRGNAVDSHMHRLRRAIDEGFDAPLLHTIARAGYMLRARSGVPDAG